MKTRFSTALFIILLFAATAVSAEEGYRYVGSRRSNKYHYPGCYQALKIRPEYLVKFKNASTAQAEGYVPCKVCNPPKRN